MNHQEIIERYFAGTAFLVRGKAYPETLPEELAAWYCYTSDGGHSILCLLEGHFTGEGSWQELCPCPVKAVRRKYRLLDEFIVASLKYDRNVGLLSDPADDEY